MKAIRIIVIAFILSMILAPAAMAQDTPEHTGHAVASAITEATGVSVSPLLGLTVIGAIKYFKAEEKTKVPWNCQPWFWGPAMLILILIAVKDNSPIQLAGPLKQPLEIADAVQMQISGLIGAAMIIPGFMDLLNPPVRETALFLLNNLDLASAAHAAGEAAAESSPGYFNYAVTVITAFLGTIVYVMVWLGSNAVNVVIMIAPFPFVGTVLKSIRTVILAVLVIANSIHPLLGLAVAIALILVAYLIAYWSFRLTVFGTIVTFEYIFRSWQKTNLAGAKSITAFSSGGPVPPHRTLGKLSAEDGRLVFQYRPWLILPRKTIVSPRPAAEYRTARSLLYPHVVTFGQTGPTGPGLRAAAPVQKPRNRNHPTAWLGVGRNRSGLSSGVQRHVAVAAGRISIQIRGNHRLISLSRHPARESG